MGCGRGGSVLVASVLGCDAYGIGTEDYEIRSAQRFAQQIGLSPFFASWNESFKNLPDASFDTVVVNGLPSHLSVEDSIDEALRICSANGRLVVGTNQKAIIDKSTADQLINHILKRRDNISIDWVKEPDSPWSLAVIDMADSAGQEYLASREEVNRFFQKPLPLPPLDTSGKVSVIISTYNRATLLKESLESVLGQTYSNTEIIVVDDGSTDNTDEIVGQYLSDIRYIKKKNGGKSSALNVALKEATGEYIWIIDDDDIALPKKLEIDIRFLQNHPEVDIVHSYGYRFDDATGEILSLYMSRIGKPEETLLRILEWPQILNVSMVAKKKCYDAVGFFREELIRSEDYEMWFRLARQFKIELLPCATVLVRMHTHKDASRNGRLFSLDEEIYYERKVFSEIHDQFALKDYYPLLERDPSNEYLQAVALLERARIMSMHYLNDLSARDLSNLLDKVKCKAVAVDIPLADRMLNIWQQAILKKNISFSRSIERCLRGMARHTNSGTHLSNYISKRYFWSF
jgi:glycosyltransferase involved in cell wall biosynthesis